MSFHFFETYFWYVGVGVSWLGNANASTGLWNLRKSIKNMLQVPTEYFDFTSFEDVFLKFDSLKKMSISLKKFHTLGLRPGMGAKEKEVTIKGMGS